MLPTGQWDYNAAVTYSSKNTNGNAHGSLGYSNDCTSSTSVANGHHNVAASATTTTTTNNGGFGWDDCSSYVYSTNSNHTNSASVASSNGVATPTLVNNHQPRPQATSPHHQSHHQQHQHVANGVVAPNAANTTTPSYETGITNNSNINNNATTTAIACHNNNNNSSKGSFDDNSVPSCRVRKPAMALVARPRAATFANVLAPSSDVSDSKYVSGGISVTKEQQQQQQRITKPNLVQQAQENNFHSQLTTTQLSPRARAETSPNSSQQQPQKTTMHTYTAQEKTSFSNYLNQRLTDVPPTASGASGLTAGNLSPQLRSQYLPIDPNTEDLFQKLKSGVLLCAIFNKIRPYTIPEKKIIEYPKNHFEQLQNCTEALRAGNELGFSIVNIGPEDIIAGKPHLVLGLVWQIVRYDLVQSVNLSKHPEILALIEPNEEVSTFVELTPEVNLLRWFNYHLKQAGSPRRVTNFSKDLADSESYITLLSQIAPATCNRSVLNDRDINRRAQYVIDSSAKLGCSQFISPLDIVNGNWKLNLAFVAELFHKRNALQVNEQQAGKLKEVEELMRSRLRKEEDEMREKLAQEERRIKSELAKMEEEQRARLAREEEMMRNRFQSEPPYPNTTVQQQTTSYGTQAKDFAKPIDSSSFLASQTDPYTSQRRFSAQNSETTITQQPPVYQPPGYQASQGGSQIHNAAPGLYQSNNATQFGTSSQAQGSSLYGVQGAQGVQGSFRENQSSYRREECAPPPPPGFLPSNLHSSAAMPPVPPRHPSAANLLSRTTTTTGTGPTMMSYEQRTVTTTTSVPSVVAPPPPMISARQAYELNTSSYTGSGITTGTPMVRTENIYVQPPPPPALATDSVYHPSPLVRTDSSWMLNSSRPPVPVPQPVYSGPSLQVAPVSTMPMGGGYSSTATYGTQSTSYGGRFPLRMLKVYVFEARNVAKKDLMGLMSSDPYVVVERKGAMRKTKACHSTRRPVWYEEFEFPVVDWHETIYVTMWDRDKFGKDDFLGQVILTKEDFMTDTERWYTLRSRPGSHDRVSGEIRLGLRAA